MVCAEEIGVNEKIATIEKAERYNACFMECTKMPPESEARRLQKQLRENQARGGAGTSLCRFFQNKKAIPELTNNQVPGSGTSPTPPAFPHGSIFFFLPLAVATTIAPPALPWPGFFGPIPQTEGNGGGESGTHGYPPPPKGL